MVKTKQKLFRSPKIKNKYNLKPKDIERAIVLDKSCFKKKPFWRNDVIGAYCLSGTTIKSGKDAEFGTYNEYWVGFYDDNAKAYAGKIKLRCSSYGGMCHYEFSEFFNPEEIDCEIDLEIQEKLLTVYEFLIDNDIISIPGIPVRKEI